MGTRNSFSTLFSRILDFHSLRKIDYSVISGSRANFGEGGTEFAVLSSSMGVKHGYLIFVDLRIECSGL